MRRSRLACGAFQRTARVHRGGGNADGGRVDATTRDRVSRLARGLSLNIFYLGTFPARHTPRSGGRGCGRGWPAADTGQAPEPASSSLEEGCVSWAHLQPRGIFQLGTPASNLPAQSPELPASCTYTDAPPTARQAHHVSSQVVSWRLHTGPHRALSLASQLTHQSHHPEQRAGLAALHARTPLLQ